MLTAPVSLLWGAIAATGLLMLGVAAGLGIRTESRQSPEVVPSYFRSSLDGLNEGIMALDYSGTIVFCNRTFLELSGLPPADLVGVRARELNWQWTEILMESEQDSQPPVPWLEAVKSGRIRCGRLTGWPQTADRVFVMHSVPVGEENERPRGALISLMDVTRLHQKQTEMTSLLSSVRDSSRQIRQQQAEMEALVLHDPLTGCFHRRYGIELLSRRWGEKSRDDQDFACLLVNVDHLRGINEAHGQSQADRVLREIAGELMRSAHQCDVVCRYDGDEFLVLMPETDALEAVRRAESMRQRIARMQQIEEVVFTVSIGVACRSDVPGTYQEMLTRAGMRLMQAKEEGRNRVCWMAPRQTTSPHPQAADWHSPEASRIIPYPAVTALISALAYRDLATASHSRRVADFCVLLGQRLMSLSSCYVLEMSALLHDIGKIGVPDALLHKAAPLTDDEWEVMRMHDRMGVEIVRTAFANPELTEIVRNYTRRYDDVSNGQPPLGARILAVADAYDSMTSQQIYRDTMTPEEALAELRRCAGAQFDPEIVSHFAEVLLLKNSDVLTPLSANRDAALAVGMELERLSEAVDRQDLEALGCLAKHLYQTANQLGAPEISAKAMELELSLEAETDRVGILQCANELLNYCRASQASYTCLNPPSQMDFSGPAPARTMSGTELVSQFR